MLKNFVFCCVLPFAGGCGLEIGEPGSVSDRPACDGGGCSDGQCPSPYPTVPPVDVPPSLRQGNYSGGSCMHASIQTVLNSQNQNEIAAYWRRNWSGAAGVETCARIAEQLGLRFAYTTKGDEEFLDWCSRTRRAAAVYYGDNHAVTFLGYNQAGEAVLVDNNRTDRYQRVPRQQFLQNWRAAGGGALTTVYYSLPAWPWV
jgi:hypothetical protein